jgi:hypothetical protein
MDARRVTTMLLPMLALAAVAMPSWQGRAAATAPTQPPPRASMGLTTAPNGTVLLFGGSNADRSLGDTWTWDGTAWTEQHPSDSPSPRCCFGMTYDLARGEVVLFGGWDGWYLGDTWTWDGSTWTEQHPANSPSPGSGVSMTYDAARREVVLVDGGGTWTWDGSSWTKEHPRNEVSQRVSAGMTYDRARGEVVVFGGYEHCFEWYCYQNDTVIWNGTDWRTRRSRPEPPAGGQLGMAFDRTGVEVVMFGGLSECCRRGSTWTWDGSTWTLETPANRPDERDSLGMTWDSVGQQVIMFGGQTYEDGYRYLGDTWAWDGSTWTCLAGCG